MVTVTAVASGCIGDGDDHGAPQGPLITATATIKNELPSDGCSYVVAINGVDHAPDTASREAIIARMLPFVTTVSIKYRLTGNTGQVNCGFVSHKNLPEIALVFDE
jgi:hypothetical protein